MLRCYLLDIALVAFAILFIAVQLNSRATDSPPAGQCGAAVPGGANRAIAAAPGTTEVTVWAPAVGRKCGFVGTVLLAADQVSERRIQVVPEITEVLGQYSASLFEQAAAVQDAPDISYVENRGLVALAEQGYLEPLDECRARYVEFAAIDKDLWPHSTWDGKIWGAPAGLDVGVLYFNKEKLRALNWSDEMIESLPERIRTGAWTLDDMLDTIRQARELGVIAAGQGFWPNYHRRHTFWLTYAAYAGRIYDFEQAKLVIRPAALADAYRFHRTLLREEMEPAHLTISDRLNIWPGNAIWRDAEAHGWPLFWQASTSFWLNYVAAAPEIGEAGMIARTGMALFPAATSGSPGHSWVHNFGWYVIASEQASGRRRQDAACAVLSKTLLPEVYAQNIRQTGRIVAFESRSPHPALTADPFTARTLSLWDNSVAFPSFHPTAKMFDDIVILFLLRVERGELTPETAAEAATLRLQNEVGDDLLVE